MGILHKSISCVHESLIACVAKETLLTTLVAIFDNIFAPTMRADRPIRLTIICCNNAKRERYYTIQINRAQLFQILYQGTQLVLHVIILLFTS